MSGNQEQEKTPESKDVDLNAAGRGVWLVKVPKYLSERWKKAEGKCEVGKLRITRSKIPGKKAEVSFTMNESQIKQEVPGQPSVVGKDHQFILTGVGNQNLMVYSRQQSESSASSSAEAITERIALEGKVLQRAECRPVADSNYLKLKKLQMESVQKPKREIQQLTGVVNTYKPISDHLSNIAHNKKLKEEGKRIRQDKEQVMDKLFNIFEKHQYYNISDLVRLTNQPITYLKEILKEICTYNVKAPHKNMWELKPEYRHYKEQK